MRRALEADLAWLRAISAWQLGERREEAATGALRARLADDAEEVRLAAARALALLGVVDGRAVLVAALEAGSDERRVLAVALGRPAGALAPPIGRALEALSGFAFGEDVERWKAWLALEPAGDELCGRDRDRSVHARFETLLESEHLPAPRRPPRYNSTEIGRPSNLDRKEIFMQPSRFWIAGAIAAVPAIVCGAVPCLADEAEDLGRDFDRELHCGACYVEESRPNPEHAAETVKNLEDIIARLEKAAPGAPKIAEAKKALEEYREKAAAGALSDVKQRFEREKESFRRHVDEFEGPDARKGVDAAENFAQHATDTIARAKTLLDEARPALAGAPAGKAFFEDADKWLAAAQAKVAGAGRVAEARRLISVERVRGEESLDSALDLVGNALDNQDPERALQGWDAAQKLVKPLEDPKFADIADAKAILERYKKTEARVAAELKPMLAKARVGPLIESARHKLRSLNEAVDRKDMSQALDARAKLRAASGELQEWKDAPDAKDFLDEVGKALARSDEELGDGLALAEIEAVEKQVKPPLERLTAALDRKNAAQVRRYAPAVREKMEGLRPFAGKSRAKVLLDRCEQALARLEREMGPAIQKQLEEESSWPKLAVDYGASSDVQRACLEINAVVKGMQEEYAKAQRDFEETVDLENGANSHRYRYVVENVKGAAEHMIHAARRLEEQGHDLEKLDAKNPGVDIVAKAVPKLIKRANDWKELVAKKCEYATGIGRAKEHWDSAAEAVKHAAERPDLATGQYGGFPTAIQELDAAAKELEPSLKIFPDDKDEAEEWAAKVKKLRADAEKGLIDACMAGAAEAATGGDSSKAKGYAESLKRALPNAPENEKIAKIIAGGADARMKCEAEVRAREDLLRKRALEASEALRGKFDAWRKSKAPQTVLAGTILGNLGKWKGKYVEGKYRLLLALFGDDYLEINGEIYYVSYAPDVQAGCVAAVKKLQGLEDQVAEAARKKAGVPAVRGPSASYQQPVDAEFVCEIVGASSYTPTHEVRAADGRLLGTVLGTPYPVPSVVIRGIYTKYYVVVPGVGASVDGLKTDGIVP